MYQMKRFIDMEQSPLSMFLLYQLGLCSVSYTANEYSIRHFCITIKDFSISFSRVIINSINSIIFNVPTTRITDLVRNVSDEKIY